MFGTTIPSSISLATQRQKRALTISALCFRQDQTWQKPVGEMTSIAIDKTSLCHVYHALLADCADHFSFIHHAHHRYLGTLVVSLYFQIHISHIVHVALELDFSPHSRLHSVELSPWWRHQMETFSALLALCAGNSTVPVNSPHKGQWRGALMFSLIYAWINDWVNNREAGDLRRRRGHYDVIVMHKKNYTNF